MPLAETTFGIAYDGPALRTGRMPVRDLAPALLALGDLFSLSSGVLYPQLTPVSVNVEATREGSFFVHLAIEAEAAWDQFVDIFSGQSVSALLNLRDVILAAGSGCGLFALIKRIGRRKVVGLERTPQPGTVRLKLDDQTSIEVPTDTWTLYRNFEIRRYTREVVTPIGREGIDVVKFTSDKGELVVGQDDLPAYTSIEDETPPEALTDNEQEMFVEIVSVAFIRSNKWRFSLGDHVFWASVVDEDFLDRVDTGAESFRKGDMLRCWVAVRQTRDVEGLHTEYTVLEVREHHPRLVQLTFPEHPPEVPPGPAPDEPDGHP